MTDQKISALTDGGNLQTADEVAIARAGVSYRAVPLLDGWIDDTAETWTYASGSGGGTATFTVTGDVTAKYTAGTRIKLTQTTVKYFVVTKDATVSAGTTTVTIMAGTDYTLANAAISANYHSYDANPQGYPGWFTFTTSASGFSSLSTNVGRFNVCGRVVTLALWIQGTSNATTMTITLPVPAATSPSEQVSVIRVETGSAFTAGLAEIAPGTSTTVMNFFSSSVGAAFANTGTKAVQASNIIYVI